MKDPYVVDIHDLDKTKGLVAGGKGANLGELCRIPGINVPEGFCLSSAAFNRIAAGIPPIKLDQLSMLRASDRSKIGKLSGEIRHLIEAIPVPEDIAEAITLRLKTFGEEKAYAIRSSATAEDLPTASFAGQQDSFLTIVGLPSVLTHITQCWASLFTERAVTYRILHGLDHRKVQMAVIIQKMIFPQTAGVLFTADPVTGNRKLLSIDAAFGLGERLVSGLVNPDHYKVRNGRIIDKKISSGKPSLTDEQIIHLDRIGRTIENHFGHPQDIEWGVQDGAFYILQSRPITTLFPIPGEAGQENRVYVSVGHQQMMTDAMKPLGISIWQLTTARPMVTAAGRLFVDITENLVSPDGRKTLIDVLGKSDPLIKDALLTITERADFLPPAGKDEPTRPLPDFQTLHHYDPSIVADLISRSQTSINRLKQDIQTKSGADLFDFILDDIQQLKKLLSDPQSFGIIMTAMNASAWINEKMQDWLGEKNAADTLTQSAPNNVTSEMGLALLDLSDSIRPYPEVIRQLQQVIKDDFPDHLLHLDGGQQTRDAIHAWLDKYGMRCPGEIDITKTRWSENPSILARLILSNIKNFEPGAGHRKFEQGRQEALKKEQELLYRVTLLPDGGQKVEQTKKMIGLVRNLIGYREYPKYSIVSRYWIYKQALKKEAERLVRAGVLPEKDDIYYLGFDELREVVNTHHLDHRIIRERKEAFKFFEKLTPPRVLTSEGEIISGSYHRKDLPAGALAGLAVSAGISEGRARVILSLQDADLGEDDILVTRFTDPSWTPAFVSIRGLVTEVGGLMTHGAVIAREYGLPAVVGVADATTLIKDGQRIRVHGSEGYVELL